MKPIFPYPQSPHTIGKLIDLLEFRNLDHFCAVHALNRMRTGKLLRTFSKSRLLHCKDVPIAKALGLICASSQPCQPRHESLNP